LVSQVAAFAAIAALGRSLPTGPMPRFALLTPIAYFIAVIADVATAGVLLSIARYSPTRRSTIVLALSFAASSSLLFLAMLTIPLLPSDPPVLTVEPQAGIWLYVLWHVVAAAGALAYIFFRYQEPAKVVTRRFVVLAGALTLGLVACCATGALVFGRELPVLIDSSTLTNPAASIVGALTTTALATTWVLVGRISSPTTIERGLTYSLLALTLDMTLYFGSGHRYSPAFYLGRAFLLAGAWMVLISAVQTLIESRGQLSTIELTLDRIQRDSANRAARFRALWEIASRTTEFDERRLDTILDIAASAIRPGKPVLGLLTHFDPENKVVVDATSLKASTASTASQEYHPDRLVPGTTFASERTLQHLVYEAADTRAWNALSALDDRALLDEEFGTRSFIGTPIAIDQRTYIVSFSSPETMESEPFGDDDFAFVEVVASFFRNWFTQNMQVERIQFQTEHDALTGLFNAAQFRKAIREQIPWAPFAIAYVDLDGLRAINESEGHQAGDELIVSVARALESAAGNDVVARFRGDEFGIVMTNVASPQALLVALDAYSDLFRAPIPVGTGAGSRSLRVGVSIGAARFPEHGPTAEDLMRRADVALGVAKANGGSTTILFDEGMEALLEETRLRIIELTDAIAQDQLELAYQPTFDLVNREIVGAEALIRWQHPERGYLSPAEFVPLAERNGMIGPLSRWVFHRVMRDLATMQDIEPGFRLYFNLAAENLEDIQFITEMNDALESKRELVPHLGIEVTEATAMQNVERSMRSIDILRAMGVAVAIDDFGTGYSSLSYLKRLTVDKVKIDRSFIAGLPHDERDAALTEMMLRIIDRFGFVSLAEGIETEAQVAWLIEHGCRFGQGYLMARPRPFEELVGRLKSRQAVPNALPRRARRSRSKSG